VATEDDTAIRPGPAESDDLIHALPGLARLAVTVAWHTTGWTVERSAKATRRVAHVAVHPGEAGDLVEDVARSARAVARDLFGLADLDPTPAADAARKVVDATPAGTVARRVADAVVTGSSGSSRRNGSRNGAVPSLQIKGQELLYKSRDVNYEEDGHPAYERLVESLAPDEARILRLLLLNGPQPSIDVRTGGPLGLITSRLIAPGLNMIGPRAGLKYVERVPSYLTNLNRLGLVWFSRETLRDPERYQVLEAQPEVLEAVHSVRYAKIVRRSIHLTPFGEGFCRAALLSDTERMAPLPEHASPSRRREPQAPLPTD
jgi:nucleotide-binding universal stress UspA family protein